MKGNNLKERYLYPERDLNPFRIIKNLIALYVLVVVV